ncbi:hypothetical protein AVEN_193717-1 [Araneus ventricosus]|uniref:Uncharacterized protein n=1 Tax=Araneus ventricosus TaxID=182803 RepID=A0A4Y2VR91_ARAVE|nr:hypothetical protein AVEN_193717-1 [Araneus ventricosus]
MPTIWNQRFSSWDSGLSRCHDFASRYSVAHWRLEPTPPQLEYGNEARLNLLRSGFVFSLFRCSLRLEDIPRDGMDFKSWIEIYLPKSIAIIRNDGKIVLRFSIDFRRSEPPAMWGWCDHKRLPWDHGRFFTRYAVSGESDFFLNRLYSLICIRLHSRGPALYDSLDF